MSLKGQLLLLLGGNEGDPVHTFERAQLLIGQRVGTILAISRDHWTEPWGFEDERPFLNRAILLESVRSPHVVMATCLAIERSMGRTRREGQGYGPRPIDIDMLLVEDQVISTPELEVPHPRMHQRRFALAPATDIVPGWVHPLHQLTVLRLLHELRHAAR